MNVAVLIVSYKSAALTIESLRSVHAERGSAGLGIDIRAIVVDNASGDYPLLQRAVAENGWGSWAEVILAPRNGGFAYGNNLALQQAFAGQAPDYLHLLNPDAQARRGAITSLVRFLESHPAAGIAGSSFENLDGSDWPIAFRFPSLISELCAALHIGLVSRLLQRWQVPQHMSRTAQPVDWVSGASMLIRERVFETIGGLDENYFLYFEETDFCRRARDAGFATWYVPESRVMHDAGQSTKVMERTAGPTRLPAWWFESRRRYFAVAFGMRRTILIDLLVALAYPIGLLKRLALGRGATAVPRYYRDFLRHSVLWPRNRILPPLRGFFPS
ncbi:MAG TPA: glycosyltransferase family 2 protein [Steroidobacteraceae bacterium]|nr:glycosyltransferase family 2 protein [Steroidobacteraceae bacterium]